MKAQAELVNFMILFLILTVMMFAAYFWAVPMLEDNNDIAKKAAAEQFVRSLDSKIQSIAKAGGYETMEFTLDGSLQIRENGTDRWIEYKTKFRPEFPETWHYLAGNESFEVGPTDPASIIRERKVGSNLYIELWYRKTGNTKIEIVPVKKLATRYIRLEKLEPVTAGGTNKILVKVEFK